MKTVLIIGITFVTMNVLVGATKAQTNSASNTMTAAQDYSSSPGSHLPIIDPVVFQQISLSQVATKAGDEFVKNGEWDKAFQSYQDAVASWRDNSQALYGLGKCMLRNGDIASAVGYYRLAMYSKPSTATIKYPGDGFRETNCGRVMEYVIMLSQNGQIDEALAAYHHGVKLVNYINGHPQFDILLPAFTRSSKEFTLARLQAMAHLGLALTNNYGIESNPPAEFKQATALAPDMAVSYYYLGKYLKEFGKPGAKDALLKAIQLDNGEVKAAAQKKLQ